MLASRYMEGDGMYRWRRVVQKGVATCGLHEASCPNLYSLSRRRRSPGAGILAWASPFFRHPPPVAPCRRNKAASFP